MLGNFVRPGLAVKLRTASMLCLAGALGLLSACDKQPEGQVVAVVNGDEITQQELNAELGNTQLPEGEQADAIRNAALANVINRRLVAGVAREEGIESTPEFILRRKQMEEALLVQLLSQKTARDLKQPSPEDIDRFIAANPQTFAERTLFAVDQIRFAEPNRKDYLDALRGANNMTDVVAILNRFGIKFDRRNAQVDSATLTPDLFRKIRAVGTSEPIVIPSGPTVTVSQILEMKSAPIQGADARQAASNGFQQQAVSQALEEKLNQAKEEAGIDYQPGFGPAPEKNEGTSAGAGGLKQDTQPGP